jgi:hypothetical protein
VQQVYTVHALVEGKVLPMCYVLMSDKSEASYTSVYTVLTTFNLQPTTVMSDFEKAAQNALHAVFPNANITGCFFHLGQCVYRKVQEAGLQRRYGEDPDFRLQVKLMPALAMLPPADVIDGFNELQLDNSLDVISDYFEETFIGRQRRGRRAQPLFNIAIWNVSDRIAGGLPRTNNAVEGWHRSFNRQVDIHHPNPFTLIDVFRKEQSHTENLLAQLSVGRQVARNSRSKYLQITRRLQTLQASYDVQAKSDFLRGVAHNIDL